MGQKGVTNSENETVENVELGGIKRIFRIQQVRLAQWGQTPPKCFRRRSLFGTFLTHNDVEAIVVRYETESLI